MIASAGTTFMASIEHNVAWMSKQIVNLKNKLYESEQRDTVKKQGKRRMDEENVTLHL